MFSYSNGPDDNECRIAGTKTTSTFARRSRNLMDAALRPQSRKKLASSNAEDFDVSTDGARLSSVTISAAAALAVVELTSAAACDPDQDARAHVAVVEREPGYSITALQACPDRYCASFGRRLLIFGMTANVATVAKICPAELAAICASEVTTICILQSPRGAQTFSAAGMRSPPSST
jgi:hypothetical protein